MKNASADRDCNYLVSAVVSHTPHKIDPLNKVHHADFCASESIVSGLEFDIIIADPPYNIGKDFGISKDNMPLEDYVKWSVEWIDICLNNLKDDGVMYIYGFPEIIAHIAVKFPIEKQKWLVWHYTNKNVPGYKFWQRSHETILCLWKRKQPALNIDNIREEYTDSYKKCIGKVRRATKGRFSQSGIETIYNGHANGALPRDVLKQPALAGGAGKKERLFVCKSCGGGIYSPDEKQHHKTHDIETHPTQKPMALTERLLLSAVNKGSGRVLIPFAGTGSECVVSQKLGLEFIGFDTNGNYVDFARQWLDGKCDV